jgi:omega-6 fatty acid desaturase (delta-12 desaturase)
VTITSAEQLKTKKNSLIANYAKPENKTATMQLINTLGPFFLLWYLALLSLDVSWWLTGGCIALLILFLLRIFTLMHDAGHNSLFASTPMNKLSGFMLGVLCGMPQYVWSQNHNYHHTTNGNWSKYRGPLSTLSITEFAALSEQQKRSYVTLRKFFNAPLGGFMYLIFNPRVNWLKGCIRLIKFILAMKKLAPEKTVKEIAALHDSKVWKDNKEFWHMTANNLLLLSIWVLMSWWIGPLAFFAIYLSSVSLAGAGGIILFTVQHNFKHAYAADNEHWDYHQAALHGTSYLKLPKLLHWFTADIGYHHIHHLSARIPNYQLKQCHVENKQLFTCVPRLKLSEIQQAFDYILWDNKKLRIISVAEFYTLYPTRSRG